MSKSDPKYQTLPYNTKFTVNLIPARLNSRPVDGGDNNNVNNSEKSEVDATANHHISNNVVTSTSSSHMTVHSAPLNVIKNIATPLGQNDLLSRKTEGDSKKSENSHVNSVPPVPTAQVIFTIFNS